MALILFTLSSVESSPASIARMALSTLAKRPDNETKRLVILSISSMCNRNLEYSLEVALDSTRQVIPCPKASFWRMHSSTLNFWAFKSVSFCSISAMRSSLWDFCSGLTVTMVLTTFSGFRWPCQSNKSGGVLPMLTNLLSWFPTTLSLIWQLSLFPECKDDNGEVAAEVGDLEVKLLQPLLSLESRVRKNWHLRSLKNEEKKLMITFNFKGCVV